MTIGSTHVDIFTVHRYVPPSAPTHSWWVCASSLFYLQAREAAERMCQPTQSIERPHSRPSAQGETPVDLVTPEDEST